MEVEVRVFAGLHKYVNDMNSGEAFSVTVNRDITVSGLLNLLGIPENEVFVTMVNGQASQHSVCLSDGDRIGIFPAVGGG